MAFDPVFRVPVLVALVGVATRWRRRYFPAAAAAVVDPRTCAVPAGVAPGRAGRGG